MTDDEPKIRASLDRDRSAVYAGTLVTAVVTITVNARSARFSSTAFAGVADHGVRRGVGRERNRRSPDSSADTPLDPLYS